jgi:hypothetical protein
MKKKTNKSVEKKDLYQALLKVLGKTYSAEGSSVGEAITSLKPLNCKGRGILTITHGEAKKDRILTNVTTYRLFNSHGFTKEIAIKNIISLFQGI